MIDFAEAIAETLSRSSLGSWTGRLGGVAVEVRCDDAAPIEYVGRFSARSPVDPETNRRITQIVAEDLMAQLDEVAGPVRQDRTKEVFIGVRYEAIADVPGLEMIAYRRVDGQRHWVIPWESGFLSIVDCTGGVAVRQPIRLLRELILREAEEHLILHGSAAVHKAGCVMFLGPSGSGKTTMALNAAEHAEFDLLGNDCLIVRDGVVSALPVSYRIGLGTVHGSAKLVSALPNLGRPLRSISEQTEARQLDGMGEQQELLAFGARTKHEVPPVQLAGHLGRRVAESAECRVVVISRMEPGHREFEFEEIAGDEAFALAHSELKIPVEWPWLTPLLTERTDTDEALVAGAEQRLRKLVDECRTYSLRIGVDALSGARQVVADRIAQACAGL